MRKSLILTIVFFLAAAFTFAQTTQYGYVKTKGRMDSNGILIPGTRLSGAAVQLTGGHSTVADANGNFTLTAPDKKFYLNNVQKQGYVLTDPDILKKQYACSANPLVISMETKEKQADDELAAIRKLRRQLQKQIQQRIHEIDSLKEYNRITEEEYRQAQREIMDDQKHKSKLIPDMAKRYAEIDYDLLDTFYKQVAFCIENGNFVKADALLRSRGDVQQQVKELLEKVEARQNQEADLQKAKAVYAAENEELARLCYSYYEIFAAQFENDSAAYYLEMRANLDTTNVDWQLEAGLYIGNYMADYDKAMTYYQRALRQSLSQYGENHLNVATSYNNIGSLYNAQGNYDYALECNHKALTLRKSLLGENHPDVAVSYGNIGNVYISKGNHIDALEYYQKSLTILKSVYGENNSNVASIYNNIGYIYEHKGDFSQAIEYYKKALAIWKLIYGERDLHVATSYNNIGAVSRNRGDYEHALEYYQKSLTILKSVYGENHPEVATCYSNIGVAYGDMGNYSLAIEYHQKAIVIKKSVYGEIHPDVALSYNNIGHIYSCLKDNIHAMEFFQKAVDIRKSVYGENHPNLVSSYNNIGVLYEEQGDHVHSMEFLQKALAIKKSVYEENHPSLAISYNNVGILYDKQGDYVHALEYIQKALDIREAVLGDTHPDTKKTANRIELLHKKILAQDSVAMKQYVFTITFGESNGQNLSSESIVLEYGDWSIDSAKSLYAVQNGMEEKPITILMMKDDVITQHTLENGIGGTIDLKQVGKKEKARIIRLYHNYKK